MACKYGYVQAQTLQPGAAAILNNIRPCRKRPQMVIHEDNTPNITMRGASNGCGNAQWNVRFSGNIAVATGGTPGEISLALSIAGYIYPLSIAMATPAAVGEFFHVSGDETFDIPCACCQTVTVVNSSADTAISVQNLGVEVQRVA